MTTVSGRAAARSLQRRVAISLALFAAVGPLVALGGWALGLEPMAGGIPGLRAIHPNGAVALLFLALSVPATELPDRRGRWAGSLAAVIAATLGAAALSAYLGGPGSTLDTIWFTDVFEEGTPLRMSPQTAVNSVLLGVAVLVSVLFPRWLRTVTLLTATTAALSATVLIGYMYGADMLVQPFGARATAPISAVGFHVLAVGVYVRALPIGLWETFTAATPTVILLRRVLPAALATLVVVGYLALFGFRAGVLSSEVAMAVTVVLSGVVLGVLLLRAGFQLNRYVLETQRARDQADAAYQLLHRQALELNDDVVQRLSIAWLAYEAGDIELAHRSVREATEQAERIAAELMQARAETDPVVPGSLVRNRDVGTT